MKLNDGKTHKIFFTLGKLYLDGIQIAGEGIIPPKDVAFEFKVNTKEEQEEAPPELIREAEFVEASGAPEFLHVFVSDDVNGTAVFGPPPPETPETSA